MPSPWPLQSWPKSLEGNCGGAVHEPQSARAGLFSVGQRRESWGRIEQSGTELPKLPWLVLSLARTLW